MQLVQEAEAISLSGWLSLSPRVLQAEPGASCPHSPPLVAKNWGWACAEGWVLGPAGPWGGAMPLPHPRPLQEGARPRACWSRQPACGP